MERIIISKLYDILLYKSHNNILLYGNGDKLNILDNLFYRLYDIKIVRDNKLLEKTDIYYYINCNRKVTYDDIYNYTLSLNYYKKNILYIILDNFNQFKDQIKLKNLIEKLEKNIKFIFLANNKNNIINYYKSSCVNFNIIKEDNYYIYNKYIKLINNIFNENIGEDIFIDKIRLLIYNYKQSILDDTIFFKLLIDNFTKNQSLKKKILIIKEISNIDHKLQNKYNNIIYYEYLLIKLYYIIKKNII